MLHNKGGIKYYFNKWGLIEKKETNPFIIEKYSRNTQEQVTRISAPHNQNYNLHYDLDSKLHSITDPIGRTISYSYDEQGAYRR